jgi:hypothetical protein
MTNVSNTTIKEKVFEIDCDVEWEINGRQIKLENSFTNNQCVF